MNAHMTIDAASAPPTEPALGHRSRRVLVAEDDDDMRRLIATALRRAGYGVSEARDGIEVLDQITSKIWGTRPHLFGAIVSDLDMPGLSGLDLLAALRCSRWHTPVIFVTAFGDIESRAEAGALGAFAYLEKPVDIAQLRDALEAAIGTRSGRD